MSAYIAEALEEKAKQEDLASMLTEMLDETGGPLTAHERREADLLLGRSSKRAPAKRPRKR